MIFPVSNLPMSSSGSEDKEWRVGESSFLMPGFRFHPTEEELVEFYLRRKVEGKHFNIELIASVDLYGYDPWELPALAFTGEKEWYFYVQRDRKYRNGDRPNRVTKSGYWKATGADRMIHNEVSRCIGLKKSLVFYKGKAPKGKRTSWIMNEYRLPKLENQRMPEELITGVNWLVESIKIYDKRKERAGTNEDRLPKLESQRTHESELCLCRVYRKSRGSEEGFQQAKERHMKIENHEDQEMHQCQTCMPCSNPRTTGEFCNLGINEVGKDEIVNLENLPTNIKIIPKPLTEEERFRAHMEYGVRETMEYDVPDQSKIQERIYSEGGNVWSTPCGSTALNEDLELYLTACLMCPRAPDQLAMSEGLYADNPSNLVLNNALTYGACMPNYSDKLWEWNPVRDDGNGASC